MVSAGIGFLAVPVAEARVDAERDFAALHPLTVLINHVRGAAVHRDILFHHEIEGLAVEDVRGIDDGGGVALGLVARGQGAMDLAATGRV